MLKRFSLRYVLFALFVDTICVVGALKLATYLRQTLPYGLVVYNPKYPEGIPPLYVYPMAVFLWIITAFAVSLYDPRKSYKAVDEFQTLTLTIFFFALTLTGALYFSYRETSRVLMIYALASLGLAAVGWRLLARFAFRLQPRGPSGGTRVLVIGAGAVGRRVAAMIESYAWTGLSFVGYLDDDPAKRLGGLPVLGRLEDVEAVVKQRAIDDVVLALPPQAHRRMNMVVSRLHELPVTVRVIPDYFSLALFRATIDDFGGIPMINLRDPALNDYQRLLKRLFDLFFGSLLTLAALPLMALIALAIKLDSPGPVLFRQKRVGENGRLFNMYKFRSMVVNAEALQAQVNQVDAEGRVVHKVAHDPRVTRVGRFIRRWSLDELPQFFNVLKGDISLVGPRPELPWLVDDYELWQRKRFAVPQGLTGWWQVNGRSDKTMHLHTDEDLYYVQNYSLWLDIYILFIKTPWVVLKGKGAY
ncbi:MAG TPA: sugar transferase [Anaerolineae bacterium]|nr:sugar transferase [Anaerolineae bacterium]